jgi:hypothetical protein
MEETLTAPYNTTPAPEACRSLLLGAKAATLPKAMSRAMSHALTAKQGLGESSPLSERGGSVSEPVSGKPRSGISGEFLGAVGVVTIEALPCQLCGRGAVCGSYILLADLRRFATAISQVVEFRSAHFAGA